MATVTLQANIVGFSGANATVIGFLDDVTGYLLIKKGGNLVNKRFDENCALVTNLKNKNADYDVFFTDKDLSQAIDYYDNLNSQGMIKIDSSLARAIPQIQSDKITERGVSYSIYKDILNEQVGVLAICFLAKKITEQTQALDLFDEFMTII